jgi:hypothetical protein
MFKELFLHALLAGICNKHLFPGGTVPMHLNLVRVQQAIAATTVAFALSAGAQTPAADTTTATQTAATPAATAQTPATAATPAAAPAPPTWSVGPMDISGMVDVYYSDNFNRPNAQDNGQVNDLYDFNDKTDQFNISAAKFSLNHDPDPVGAHVDFIYGRTNNFINQSASNSSSADQLNYIEQAFLSLKPAKAKGFELDFGKFVTSAGAEVIESKDNWNYSRSLLFSWAIPYWHFGVRTSMPVSKVDTIGIQVVNGWNNVSKSNGGATIVLTNALTKPKYAWNVNYIFGPENSLTSNGFRNLIDTTLLFTPNAKFNAYINYDYGQNRDGLITTTNCDSVTKKTGTLAAREVSTCTYGDKYLNHWQGIAGAFHEQANAKNAIAGRFEWFNDPQGYATYTAQQLYEFTGTYEYKWLEGLLMRAEYRADFSNVNEFSKGVGQYVKSQQTLTVAFVAFFGPKR